MSGPVPSSHGSLDGEAPVDAAAGSLPEEHGEDEEGPDGYDGFDSDEFRTWLRERNERRRRDRDGAGGRRRRGGDDDSEDERAGGSKGPGGGLPPEWDGKSVGFQDWLIKARLWLATTRAKGPTQGPMILQRLSGQPFQSFKHWAKDARWLSDDRGGHQLLQAMDSPEYFGEDTEEELLAALSKLTYHIKRTRDETCRQFFTRWDDAVRKIGEHRVQLPDKYLGFLLINALSLTDQDTKALMAFSRGSILVKDVKEWCRKHEMKLQVKDVGTDRKVGSKSFQTYLTQNDADEEDEIRAFEEFYNELHPDDCGGDGSDGYIDDPDDVLEEHEAKEILNTMVSQTKKKTFLQSLKTKRAKALARGYGQWRDRGPGSSARSQSSLSSSGYVKGGYYRMTLSEAKARSKCSKCGQVGHWHKDPECPRNQGGTSSSGKPKEINFVEKAIRDVSEEAIFCGHVEMVATGLNSPECSTQNPPATDREDATSVETDVQTKDQFGSVDTSKFCPTYKDRVQVGNVVISGSCGGVDGMCDSEKGYPVFWGELLDGQSRNPTPCPDELCATIDTGCQRMAIGLDTLQRLDQCLPDGLQSQLTRQDHKFRSVHGTSTTRYAAVIPTSLGSKGSLLRPAIFDTPESRTAPFLISLPFLMFCRGILTLDPQIGLSLELKRFGVKVPCHLGPSGALRIPLGKFTNSMKERLTVAQQEFQNQQGEFEVLRTTQVFAQDAPCDGPDAVQFGHGREGSDQEIPDQPGARSRASDRLAEDRHEDDLLDGAGDGADGAAGRLDPTSTHTLLGLPAGAWSEDLGHPVRNARGPGKLGELFHGRDGGSQHGCGGPESTIHRNVLQPGHSGLTGIEHGGISDHRGPGRVPHGRGPEEVGATTTMPTRPVQQGVPDQEAGSELRSPVLAMCTQPSGAMPVLRMGRAPANMEPGGDARTPQEGRNRINDVTEDQDGKYEGKFEQGISGAFAIHSSVEHPANDSRRDMSTPPNHQDRDQRLCRCREVRGLRISGEEGKEEEPQPKCDHPGEVGGVPGVPGVPELAEESGSIGWEQGAVSHATPESPNEDVRPFAMNRRVRRTLEQAKRALRSVEEGWTELMSLLRTEPGQSDQVGWSHLGSECLDSKDLGRVQNRQALQKYVWMLGRTEKQIKTVSELYNPNRFQGEVKRFGLCQGQAFDLELGWDLLDKGMRQEVRKHIREIKPGLVVISPPCTLFSILQNLSVGKRNAESAKIFVRRLMEAKVLLQFGIEAALEVLSYGGTFVFEHPLTSRAWSEPMMQKLITRSDVYLTVCDQCRYGLRAVSGLFHRKPTGFLSNNSKVIEQLGLRCDHSHQHEPVLGSDRGGARSRQSQRYPPLLVQAILRGYQRSLQESTQIWWTTREDLRRDLFRHHLFLAETYEAQNVEMSDTNEILTEHVLTAEDIDISIQDKPSDPEEVQPLPREKPFSLEQLVRRAHEGLGHPGNERLARILKDAKASEKAVAIAKNLKCSVCERHAATRPARRAAPPRHLHVNQTVGVDTVYLPDHRGKTRMALNIVDWASRFQMMIPLSGHSPGAARRAYLQWVRLFGPPENLYTDLGREFLGAFPGAEHDSTFIDPSALEMPTQRGITERAGRNFKEILSKTMMQVGCSNYEEWQETVDIVNMTCNRLMNKSGYSPIQRVIGYTPRIPGGLMTGGGNDLATMSRVGGDLQVQRAAEIRLAASKAFHEADAEQALKNALHAGHRTSRDFEVGQLVYFWRKGTDGPKKNRPGFWRGPCRVVLTSPPSVVWINFKGFVVKAAPEQLRLASEEERFTLTDWVNDITGTRAELEKQPRQGYLDLTKLEFPTDEDYNQDLEHAEQRPQDPRFRLNQKTAVQDVPFQQDERPDEWRLDEHQGLLHRIHRQPREERFQPAQAEMDCPVDLRRLKSRRTTTGQYLDGGSSFREEDDWIQAYGNEIPMMPWTGRTSFQLHPAEDLRDSGGLSPGVEPRGAEDRSPGHEPRDGPRPDPCERPDDTEFPDEPRRGVKHGGMDVEESENEDQPHLKRPRTRSVPGESEEETGYEPSLGPEDDEMDRRGEVRNREEELEEEPRHKRNRTNFVEIFLSSLDKVMAAKLKKEVKLSETSPDEKHKFLKAIEKEVKNNMKTNAYEMVSPEESEQIRRNHPEKIVKSRFVLTEKSIEEDDVEAARVDGVLLRDEGANSTKAKARHVMKGFSEENAESLETTTPQCGRETVLAVLQLLCSRRWKPGYLDFTQAFHSGDEIKREIYASQPTDCPLPGYSARQLLRLKKTCYGLLDGPYAWYQHLKKVLTSLDYVCSAADPCLFYLFDAQGLLHGIISVATDDLLHGGTDLHWQKMQWLNENYKLGKFTSGNGRFVGKEIVCREDGSFLVNQPLYTQKLQQIQLEPGRKRQKYAFCNESEISQLRGVLGGLSWLAKETRPDLSGRVAILQQSMPRPYIQDIIEANSLVREAIKYAEVGLTIHPIPLEYLRVGTVTDASWANVKVDPEIQNTDFWEEREDRWIRHHVQPRRLLFHPASVPGGPNVYELHDRRVTMADGEEITDTWNDRHGIRNHGQDQWNGQTVFFKKEPGEPQIRVHEKFLQHDRLASQGGFITFFYDSRMEIEEKGYPISVVGWKSFRIKRCTVNTLSAECQAMIHGVGSLHWLRFLLQETAGKKIHLENWEETIGDTPCIAVTDSKSLYDTMQKCCNTAAHIEDKRTAIDVTVLKRDFQKTQGQVRWIQGTKMISDSLTKKMGSAFLRKVLTEGTWSLTERGFSQEATFLLLISADRKFGRCESWSGVS